MAINLSDSIRVGQQKPVDDKYYNGLSLYASTTEVNSSIDSAVRYIGLTVAVDDGSGGAKEYWYQAGILDTDLVEKTSGGGATAFTDLSDVPSSYTGQAGKLVQVNSGETALEFSDAPTVAGLTTDYIVLDTNPTGVPEDTGNIWWSSDFSMPYIQLNSGEKMRVGADHYIPVQAGVDITKGDVVKFTGATGDKVIGGLAVSTDEPYVLIGIASENISTGNTGFVIQFGSVDQFDTDTPGWSLGDLLYLDPSNNGKLTNDIPSAPDWIFPIAAVTRVSNAGRIQVRAIPGNHLHDIVDVRIDSITDNEILQWNSTGGYWENQTLAEAGIQPAGTYVTSVSGTSPISSSGGTTPTMSITQATSGASGYLTSTDWNTFNGKLSNIVDDATPRLGGDLDVNGSNIVSTDGGNIRIVPDTDGDIQFSPSGVGIVVIDGLSWPSADGAADQVLKTDGAGTLSFTTITSNPGTVTSVSGTGTSAGLTLTGTVTSSGSLTLGGTLDISADTSPTLGGNLDGGGNNITNTDTITSDKYIATVNALTFNATTTTFDVNSGSFATLRMTGDITTVQITHMAAGMPATIRIQNTGSFAITNWTDGTNPILWSGGTAPTITPSGTDVISFISDGISIYGAYAQNFS